MARMGAPAFLLLVAVSALMAFSCITYSGSDGGELDENGNGEIEVEDADQAPLYCDAFYVPVVTLEFVIAGTGEHYCGPVDASYTYGDNQTRNILCTCVDGLMVPCQADPPYGEATVTVEVEGYEKFETHIFVPYKCHPQIPIVVELIPL
jgi:hypothetical protein